MTDKEKIQKLIDEYGKTQEAFATFLGVATSTVANWRFRNKLTPTAISLILRKCPEINPEWLEGNSDLYRFETTNDENHRPLYDDVEIKDEEISFKMNGTEVMKTMSVPDIPSTEFIHVSGCSLQPLILQGDIIGIHEFNDWTQFKRGDIYFILTKENERLLKYIYADEDEKLLFCYSENPMISPLPIPKESIFKIYKVDFYGRAL